jgi:hypothetical protein
MGFEAAVPGDQSCFSPGKVTSHYASVPSFAKFGKQHSSRRLIEDYEIMYITPLAKFQV